MEERNRASKSATTAEDYDAEMTSEHSPLIPGAQSLNDYSNDNESITASIQSIQSGLTVQNIRLLPGMHVRSHMVDRKAGLLKCTSEEALRGAKSGRNKQHFWIDIDADPHQDAQELRVWLRELNLPNFVIDVLAYPPDSWASQVIPLQGGGGGASSSSPQALLAVIQCLPEDPESDETAHLAALHLRNIVITFTSCPRSEHDEGGLYAPALAQMKHAERLPQPTSGGALLAWLRFHLERTSRATRELRYAVLAMDESMDRDVTSVPLEEIILAKDQLLRLLSVAEEQTECLEALAAATATSERDDLFGFSTLKASLSILLATAGATERMALRLEKHISELRQRCEGHEHEKTNRRLAVLTVCSAIFLPLTLLTGIYGMNFQNMPELDKPYAYPIAITFMISIACIMICYFQRTGWFD